MTQVIYFPLRGDRTITNGLSALVNFQDRLSRNISGAGNHADTLILIRKYAIPQLPPFAAVLPRRVPASFNIKFKLVPPRISSTC